MSTEQKSLGKKITLKEANGMVQLHKKLSDIVEMTLKPNATMQADPENLAAKAQVLISKKYNAFIFTKDLIQRFFDGSETDSDGNPHCANYLMVLLGAHPIEKEGFDAGSFTVLTVGCRKETTIERDKEVVKYYPLSIPEPANEYPPTAVVELLGEREVGTDFTGDFTHFTVM